MKITKEELKNKDLKSFYIDNRNLIPQSKEMDSWLEHKGYQMLREAEKKGLKQLKILCSHDKECMIDALDLFVTLPAMQAFDKFEKKQRRPEQKNITQKRRRDLEKLKKRIEGIIWRIKLLEPKIESITLEKKVYEVAKSDPTIIKRVSERKLKTTKVNIHFNQGIYAIYLRCQKDSSLLDNRIFNYIAKILTSLHIKKSNSKEYIIGDIRGIVNRSVKQPLPSF